MEEIGAKRVELIFLARMKVAGVRHCEGWNRENDDGRCATDAGNFEWIPCVHEWLVHTEIQHGTFQECEKKKAA
jgi:hypothetical protein